MRMIIIKQATDLQALSTRLLTAGAGKEGALLSLQRLNPHVDFNRLDAGTVLLVPDQPGVKTGESTSIGGDAFDAFQEQVRASVDEAVARVRNGYAGLTAQHTEVAAVLKGAALKRALEADPDIKGELERAAQVFKRDQQQAKEAMAQLQALQAQASEELARLAKRLQ